MLPSCAARAPAPPRPPSTDGIIQKHSGLIESIVRQVISAHAVGLPKDDIEDLRQAGRIGLDRAHRRFDASRLVAFSTYAVPFIRNDVIDELKRLRRPLIPPGGALAEEDREAAHWEASEADHERRAAGSKVARRVREFVGALPRRQSQVVAVIFHDGLTQAEASRALGVSRARITRIMNDVCAKGRRSLQAFAP